MAKIVTLGEIMLRLSPQGKNCNFRRDYAPPFPTGKRPFHSE